MNKQELVEEFENCAKICDSSANETTSEQVREFYAGSGFAYREAARVIAVTLDDPVAMKWLDKPTCEGWYWVRSTSTRMRACRIVMSIKQGWMCDGAGGMRPLNGRRVCQIPSPPPLPERKEGAT